MYTDTEQAYGDWTLDVFQDRDGQWNCDWWHRMKPHLRGTVVRQRRKDAISEAKRAIDAMQV